MKYRNLTSLLACASVLVGTAAIAQETKSLRLQTRLPRAGVDPGAPGVEPAITTQGQSFFAPSPTVFGNQPSTNARILKSFNGLGDYDTRLLGRALVPPDTMGAVGTTQFVQLINGAFGVFDKNSGNLLGATSDVGFWNQLGQTGTGGDPRILFNAASQRWIAIGFGANTKDINIGVSDTADALGSWKATRFEGLAQIGSLPAIADYPTLAMDNNALYIGTNNFRQETATGATDYRGTSLFVLPIGDILSATGPSTANIQVFNTPYSATSTTNDTTRGFAIQGVNSNEAADGKGHIVAASAFINGVLAYDINNAGTGSATQSASVLVESGYASNAAARQPGRTGAGLRNIDALDDRIGSNAWEVNGKTYYAHTITVPGSDRTTVRVTVLDSNTKAVLQTLDLGEAGYDYYQGSIAVSAAGTAAIAYNRSGFSTVDGKIGIYVQTLNIQPDGTLVFNDVPILVKTSDTAGYLNGAAEATGAPVGRQRWGDYAAITLDPTDPNTFWAIGQYAAAPYETTRPGYPAASGFSRWGQYIVAINAGAVPEPATWAMMIVGFGFVGAAMRRQPRVKVTYA